MRDYTNDEPLVDGGFAGPVLLFEFALLEPLQRRNLGQLSSPRLSAPEQTITVPIHHFQSPIY